MNCGMGARQENLRTALFTANVVDISAHPVAVFVVLARNQLVAADDRLATAKVDNDVAVFDTLDRSVDDLANTVLVFIELPVPFGFADLLDDHLLGRLGGDAAKIHRRQRFGDEIADLCFRIAGPGVLEQDLGRLILDFIDDFHQALQLDLSGLSIDVGADVGFEPVTRTRRFLDRIGHRLQDDLLVDRFLPGDRVGDLQEFQPVCAYCHLVLPKWPPAYEPDQNTFSCLDSDCRKFPFAGPISCVRLCPCAARPG